MVVILDFGSQYTHLIARRIRELKVFSEVLKFDTDAEKIMQKGAFAIILSGGPMSVQEDGAPHPDPAIFKLGVPILGICYGAQLIAKAFGGDVKRARRGEYGRTRIEARPDGIFEGVPTNFTVWMSHGDTVTKLPESFISLASSPDTPHVAFFKEHIWAVQFHPEVAHTQYGMKMLDNFLKIANCPRTWSIEEFVEKAKGEIRERAPQRILCAVSGGVDSTTLAVLLKEAVGSDRVIPIFVDTGLLRLGEVDEVVSNLRELGLKPVVRDESARFLSALEGVSSPERKRKIIGKAFADIFVEFAKENKVDYLAQGTLYPDVIESGRGVGPASIIKTHHNVGGLPKIELKLIEPLKQLYKDEVREVGRILGIPERILGRHPFPGPGLAVRIIGSMSRDKIETLRQAEAILQEELLKSELYPTVWQAFCVLLSSRSTGVLGDERRYGYTVAIRCVTSQDAMTADWAKLPYDFLDKVAGRIVGECRKVTRVVYDITSKPPATIEWE